MSYTPQLQDYEYYENRYDRRVVTQCRMREEACEDAIQKELKDNKSGKSEEQIRFEFTKANDIYLYYLKGDLAIKREDKIAEWMKEHRDRDNFYNNARVDAPYCIHCDRRMEEVIKQDFFSYSKSERNRVLFMFECKDCEYRRGKWDNGEEYKPEKPRCEKCGSEDIKNEFTREEKGNTFRETCNKCGHVKEDFYEHYVEKKEKDPNYEKDREKYVLSPDKTYEFRRWIENMEKVHQMVEEDKRKKAGIQVPDVPEKKNLDVADMKDLVTKELRKQKYKDIVFSTPTVLKKGVTIELTLSGKGIDRTEFLKLIQPIFENTNWKINEKSILIQLGILQCKFEGV